MIRNSPTLKPSKLRRRRRKIFAIKTILVLLLFNGFSLLFSWFSKMPSIQIENIEVSGNLTVSKDEIINLIRTETSAKYFRLFSKNSVFLYPKESIEAKLADDFKRIETVSIKFKGLKTLIINMVERKPNSLWCFSGVEDGTARKNNNSGMCYFPRPKEGWFSARRLTFPVPHSFAITACLMVLNSR